MNSLICIEDVQPLPVRFESGEPSRSIVRPNSNIRLFKKAPYLPFEMIDLIFSYDGRIRFRNGRFSNVIMSKDYRYDVIDPVICKKINILRNVGISDGGSSFYFEFGFDSLPAMGLCYDYHWSYSDKFEICYYDFRNPNAHMQQYRTYF